VPDKLLLEIPVITEALTWMTVLGCVQLAMRHPNYDGPSREIAKKFADAIAHKLLDEGVFSPEEFALMLRDEMFAQNTRRMP
jgi:hypothetical protein